MEAGLGGERTEDGPKIDNPSTTADAPISTRQAEIIKAINGATKQFKEENTWLILQLLLWLIVCLLVILKGYCIINNFIDNVTAQKNLEVFRNFQSWQIYFYIIARVTLITGLFTIASFLLRMFRSTYHIFQSNRHRLNIIKALPSFMAASKDATKEEEILAIILKTVIKFNKTGLISTETDMKSGISLIEKLIRNPQH